MLKNTCDYYCHSYYGPRWQIKLQQGAKNSQQYGDYRTQDNARKDIFDGDFHV